MVVAGAVRATNASEASKVLENSIGSSSDSTSQGRKESEILGRIRFEATGKGKVSSSTFDSDNDSSLYLDLILPSSGIPYSCPSPEAIPIIIMYEPPHPHKLQFLSLQPLQLDLNSFISPTSRTHSFDGGAEDMDEEGKEERLLSQKMRKINEIDFTAVRGGGKGMGGIDLGQCIDWVSHISWLVGFYCDEPRTISSAFGKF